MLQMGHRTSGIPGQWFTTALYSSPMIFLSITVLYFYTRKHFLFIQWPLEVAYMFCWWRWFEWGETTLVCYLCRHSCSGTQLWRCCLLYCLNFRLQNIPPFHTVLTRLIFSVILYLSRQLCFYCLTFTKDNYGFVLSFCPFPWSHCFLTFPGHLPRCVRYKEISVSVMVCFCLWFSSELEFRNTVN